MKGPTIVRSDDLRGENRRRVLNTLRYRGPSSPACLADSTGLSPAAISSLTSQLAEQGIVHSRRPKATGGTVHRGRPQSLIDLDGSAGDIIMLSLAIDQIKVCRVDYAGKKLNAHCFDVNTRELNEAELLEHATSAVRHMLDHDSGQSVRCIGVAFQGVTHNATGSLMWSPIIKQENVPLGATLQATFDLPVSVNNDCRLISETLSHDHHKVLGDSFVTVLFSSGVGLGLYIDGQPFNGIHSSALEMGHLQFERNGALCRCGNQGCIEAYAADYGILRMAAGQSIVDDPLGRIEASQLQTLVDAAKAGDNAALQAFAIAGAAIGEGLATLFSLLDTMPVAVVGRQHESVEFMKPGLQSAFRQQRGEKFDIPRMLHCFDDAEPLLESGLMRNTLAQVDSQFAMTQASAH